MRERIPTIILMAFACLFLQACGETEETPTPTVAETESTARAKDGKFISWREHLIDSEDVNGGEIVRGGDGVVMGDLDGDGYEDVVAVYESDVEYDVVDGKVRISFGAKDPDTWLNITLAKGPEAGAAEDPAIGDINGDGYPDVVIACELSHILYLQNPGGEKARSEKWQRLIIPITQNRGSFINVALADFDGDGRMEIISANKGGQNPEGDVPPTPILIFSAKGDPLQGESWQARELTANKIPIAAEPADIDADGDIDLLLSSRGQRQIFIYENTGLDKDKEAQFTAHGPLKIVNGNNDPKWKGQTDGSHVIFVDIDRDGRLDIVTNMHEMLNGHPYGTSGWLKQPANFNDAWAYYVAGVIYPDSPTGLDGADIDGDGDFDLIVGGYSGLDMINGGYLDPRDHDGPNVTENSSVGRLAWFANPGDGTGKWKRHDISRQVRGMNDLFVPRDMDNDGDIDFVTNRGNSAEFDGALWLEQLRTASPERSFYPARKHDSRALPLPTREVPPASK